jgi:hypothetical protein
VLIPHLVEAVVTTLLATRDRERDLEEIAEPSRERAVGEFVAHLSTLRRGHDEPAAVQTRPHPADATLTLAVQGTAVFAHPGLTNLVSDEAVVARLRSEAGGTRSWRRLVSGPS